MAITIPSEASHSWIQSYALALPLVAKNYFMDYTAKVLCPTQRIFLKNLQPVEFGPEDPAGRWEYPFIYESGDGSVMKKNQTFTTRPKELASRGYYTAKRWYHAESIDEFDMTTYSRGTRSLDSLADQKMAALHRGSSNLMKWFLFSNWSESISADNKLDMETILANARIPPTTKFHDITQHSDRIFSIPMVIRKHVTGHTFGNQSSANAYWKPTVTDAAALVATRNTIAWAANTNEQTDIVTSDHAVPALLKQLNKQDIETHVNIDAGYDHEWYVITPSNLFDTLVSYLIGMTERTVDDSPLLDLGIDAILRWPSKRITFYCDQMMDLLWPNTMFFYDPDCLFLIADSAYNPRLIPWEKIGFSNEWGTAVQYWMQLVCADRTGVSAMHGYTP